MQGSFHVPSDESKHLLRLWKIPHPKEQSMDFNKARGARAGECEFIDQSCCAAESNSFKELKYRHDLKYLLTEQIYSNEQRIIPETLSENP